MFTEEQIIQSLIGSNKRLDFDCKVTKYRGHCSRCGITLPKLQKRARIWTTDETGKYNNNSDIRMLFCKDCLKWIAWIILNDQRKMEGKV